MRPEILHRLATTLEILASEGPSELAIQALWVGDEPKKMVAVTPRELAQVARLGKLETRTTYVVARGSAG